MEFRKDFIWGAATASYQIEGAAFEDGKGKNIWDVFCREDGAVSEGHNGDIACDHYHRYKEDVKILKELGVSAYRFSVNWARILPEGTGKINEKGIAFYNDLINLLLENGIEPYLTLYHWELPYELHKRGGWLNPRSPEWFYQYAKVIAENFSDRVKNFFTLNEPQCIVGLGYLTGEHAPGLKVGEEDYFHIWHNVLMAHGRATEALREYAKQKINVGIVSTGAVYIPEKETAEDIEAARKASFSLMGNQLEDCSWDVALCCDPVYLKQYPEDILRKYGHCFPKYTEKDMELIGQPVDFHGQNIYNAVTVQADERGNSIRVPRYPGFPQTAMKWPVTPECLNWPLQFLYERYKTPILVTENGMAAHDWIASDGKVHDSSRVDFMIQYLRQLKKAAVAGVDVRGYFAWSLLDNFEWAHGYSQRFGLVYVDYTNQKRTMKDSAFLYKDIIKTNGEAL